MTNVQQIRGNAPTIIQQGNVQIQTNPPALHPVSQTTFAPGGAQVSSTNAIWLPIKEAYDFYFMTLLCEYFVECQRFELLV